MSTALQTVPLELPDEAYELVPKAGCENILAYLEDLNRNVAIISVTDVVDPASEGRVAAALQSTKTIQKGIEEIKDKALRPLLDETKATRKLFVPYEELGERTAKAANRKIVEYRAELAKKEELAKIRAAQEREEAAKKEREATERAAAAKTESQRKKAEADALAAAEAGRKATEVLEKPETRGVKTEHGTTYFVQEWRYTISDPSQVPDEFWVIDESKIAKAVKAETAIPGVTAWQESVPRTRT